MSAITVPTDIYNAVAPIARAYNVPDSVWETVAYQESGFDPKNVGDQGTSFGLFQLHIGGQLPQRFYSDPQAVFDPRLNAQIAMPAIARGYQQSGAMQASNLAWWEKFGAISGHPGYPIGGNANVNEAKGLLSKFPLFSGGQKPPGGPPPAGSPNSGSCPKGNVYRPQVVGQCDPGYHFNNAGGFCTCDAVNPPTTGDSITQAVTNALNAFFSGLVSGLKPEFIKVGVFILGLALFVIAWWILLHPAQEGSGA